MCKVCKIDQLLLHTYLCAEGTRVGSRLLFLPYLRAMLSRSPNRPVQFLRR